MHMEAHKCAHAHISVHKHIGTHKHARGDKNPRQQLQQKPKDKVAYFCMFNALNQLTSPKKAHVV